jgi:hypothetical protein
MSKNKTDATSGVEKTAAALGKRATKFSQESAALQTEVPDAEQEKARENLALQIFQPAGASGQIDMSNFVDKSLPLILKPKDFKPGVSICARLEKVSPSPIAEFKNNILEFVTAKKQRFAFPDVATVHKALDDDPAKFIGHEIFICYLGLKQGRDTSRKPARLFDVKVSKAKVVYDFDAEHE